MNEYKYGVDYFENYCWPKDSYILYTLENNQLLILLVNVITLIILLMELNVFLNISEFLNYLVNHIPLFHPLVVLCFPYWHSFLMSMMPI